MTIEVTAKKVDDAIKQGLEQLGVSLDEVDVEILESGGLFRKAKVRLTVERAEQDQPAAAAEQPQAQPKNEQPKQAEPKKEQPKKDEQKQPKKETVKPEQKQSETKPQKPEQKAVKTEKPVKTDKSKKPADKAEGEERPARTSEEIKQAQKAAADFITTLVQKMGFTEATVTQKENGDVDITAPAGDDSLIIGRHGETLSAISFLAETLGRAEKQHVNIVADCNGYRERRAASLTAMAHRRANECASKHRKIKLEPMERVDRRTIHNALTDDDRVTTVSEGKEPYRYIVILPKN